MGRDREWDLGIKIDEERQACEEGGRREREEEREYEGIRLVPQTQDCKRPLEKSRLVETLTPPTSANAKRP